MSNAPILKIQKINPKNLTLDFPKGDSTNKNGFFVHVKHNKTKIRAMLPDVTAPYGAGPQKDYGQGEVKYSMGICFDGMEVDDASGRKIKSAYQTLEAIQDRIKELMLENREAFFKDAGKPKKKTDKPLSDDVLESRYKVFLRPREDKTDIMYLSMQRQRIRKEDEEKLTPEEKENLTRRFASLQSYPLLVDNEGHVLEVTTDNLKDVIPWGSVVRPIIELAYLWVSTSNQTVQPVWTFIHGARISTGPTKTFDILHPDSDDEDEEETAMDVDQPTERNDDEDDAAQDEDGGEDMEEEEEMAK